MLNKIFYICIILGLCFIPLTGCDQESTDSDSTGYSSEGSAVIPVDLDLDGRICDTVVDSTVDENGKQNFVMTIVCNGKELFHIDIDGASDSDGADGVDVDVFDNDFLNWGTKR